MGKIPLQDFLHGIRANTKIGDDTYIKREGKKVYGAKKVKIVFIRLFEKACGGHIPFHE